MPTIKWYVYLKMSGPVRMLSRSVIDKHRFTPNCHQMYGKKHVWNGLPWSVRVSQCLQLNFRYLVHGTTQQPKTCSQQSYESLYENYIRPKQHLWIYKVLKGNSLHIRTYKHYSLLIFQSLLCLLSRKVQISQILLPVVMTFLQNT